MNSQTDRTNIERLKMLRNDKLKKVAIEIRKAKLALKQATEKEANLKQALNKYHKNRQLKHKQLYGELKKNRAVTIDTLKRHQSKNKDLIIEEKVKALEVENIKKQLIERELDVEKYQQLLHALHKKIEGLNVIESSFFKR